MELGINGKRALVCAASRGLGKGSAMALACAGVELFINARGEEALAATAEDIRRETGANVTTIAGDISKEDDRARILDTAGRLDILVNNAGGPPPGSWQDWDRDDFIVAIDQNMLAPIAMMKATLPYMIEQRWGRVVNITSVSVKSPVAVLGLSNTARTGLTGYVAGVSRQVAPFGVVINNLLPGIHATDRMTALDAHIGETSGTSAEAARAERLKTIPTGTYGDPNDFGATCAFMCSEYAKFMIGQNILLDGGATNVTL